MVLPVLGKVEKILYTELNFTVNCRAIGFQGCTSCESNGLIPDFISMLAKTRYFRHVVRLPRLNDQTKIKPNVTNRKLDEPHKFGTDNAGDQVYWNTEWQQLILPKLSGFQMIWGLTPYSYAIMWFISALTLSIINIWLACEKN